MPCLLLLLVRWPDHPSRHVCWEEGARTTRRISETYALASKSASSNLRASHHAASAAGAAILGSGTDRYEVPSHDGRRYQNTLTINTRAGTDDCARSSLGLWALGGNTNTWLASSSSPEQAHYWSRATDRKKDENSMMTRSVTGSLCFVCFVQLCALHSTGSD